MSVTSRDVDLKLFLSLLRPSALSGLLCVLASLTFIASIVVLTNYQGSSFQREILQTKARAEDKKLAAISDDYALINEDFQQNSVIDKAPVMIFWMFVGTLVYFLVTGITSAITRVSDIEDELHYKHVRRSELLRDVYLKTVLRFLAFGLWLGFIILFFKVLLPYCLAVAHVGAGSITTLLGPIYVLIGAIILTFCLHAHVVMLRLVLLRPRVFSQDISF